MRMRSSGRARRGPFRDFEGNLAGDRS
jgi:hypothetical protein